MNKSEIINYIMNTPENTNPNILKNMLSNYENGSATIEFCSVTVEEVESNGATLEINYNGANYQSSMMCETDLDTNVITINVGDIFEADGETPVSDDISTKLKNGIANAFNPHLWLGILQTMETESIQSTVLEIILEDNE